MSVQPIVSASVGAAQATAVAGMPMAGAAPRVQATPAEVQATPVAKPSMAELQKTLAEVQEAIRPVAQDLLFSIDKESGRTIIKIVDSSTDEVIRQFPSEELLAIARALDRFQGLLLKQQA